MLLPLISFVHGLDVHIGYLFTAICKIEIINTFLSRFEKRNPHGKMEVTV